MSFGRATASKKYEGGEGKARGMERKRLKTEKKIQRKMKGIKRARQAWAQKLRDDGKQRKVRITKPIGKPARVTRPPKPKIRTIRGLYNTKVRNGPNQKQNFQRNRMEGYCKKRIKKSIETKLGKFTSH